MRWQHLYEMIALQAPQEGQLPETLVRALANRALQEFAARTRLLRGRADLIYDGTTLEQPPPDDHIEPLVLMDADGRALSRVERISTLAWRGEKVWHWDGERIIAGRVSDDGAALLPLSETLTLEYVRKPEPLTGDPDQEVDVPEEFIAAIESRVLEHFSVAVPELLRFHHARWRDLVHQARIRVNMLAPGLRRETRLPEL